MEKVIPPGINYSNIKPEAIENKVQLIKFLPVQTGSFRPGAQVNFNIQSNGFYDPYSAYMKFKIRLQDPAGGTAPTANDPLNGLFLDRSGHSIFNRLIIKSQGQELERIEQYDVLAAMINDVLYSREQKQLHHFEGFGDRSFAQFTHQLPNVADVGYGAGGVAGAPAGAVSQAEGNNLAAGINARLAQLRNFSIGTQNQIRRDVEDFNLREPVDLFIGRAHVDKPVGLFRKAEVAEAGPPVVVAGGLDSTAQAAGVITQNELQICIPLYSGTMGVLMPDKRLLPLSLMPLEVEWTVNPHAMYFAGLDAEKHRNFEIYDVELFAHVLFFEQELHRSLEAVVAEHGIFIHFNTFKMCPPTTIPGATVPAYAQINSHAKSINSIHWVFLYEDYRTEAKRKKLFFASHNLKTVHVRNGTELVPSLPLEGNMLLSSSYQHSQFLIEMYKAWGKMHDPSTDSAISHWNYCLDQRPPIIVDNEGAAYYNKVRLTGRCQYGISFEGEQLGQDRTTITGRKGMIPMDINITPAANKTEPAVASSLIPFVRMDAIIYVRPDLVVQVLGY